MKKFFSSPVHIIALVLAGVLALSAVLYHFLPQWLDLDQSPETADAAATAQNVPEISREDLDAWAKAQEEAEKKTAYDAAAKLEAEGEAEYMKRLAEAYDTADKQEFYEFILALDALKSSLNGADKTIILDADSDLAKILAGAGN